MTQQEQTVELAKEFAKTLQNWLGNDLKKVVARNKRTGLPDVCASHDFCDANMAMYEAFMTAFGRELSFESGDEELVNAAWDAAKIAGFDASKII